MKVLFISNGYPPRHWAGTETYTAGVAQELAAQGHAVQVLCGGDWARGDQFWNGVADSVHEGVPVRRIHMNWAKAPDPARYLYDDPESAAYLAEYLTEVRPDVVHVTSCERLSASVLHVAKAAGLPLVLSLTDFWFLCPRMSLLRSDGTNCDGLTTASDCLQCTMHHNRTYRWVKRVLPESGTSAVLTQISRMPELTRRRGLRGMAADMDDRKQFLRRTIGLPDRRLTASKFVRDTFVANGISDPIDLHPYGHDLAWLQSYQGKTASDVVRIGYIGQIIQRKGVHLLLEAAQKAFVQLGETFKIVIYGSLDKQPAYANDLQNLAASLPNVEFRGTYSHGESGDVYAEMDVLAVPSLWYDFPLVIHEAFATRTPVIASRLGGMEEAIAHEKNGLLCSPGDVDDLARQLIRIISEPGLLNDLRKNILPVKTVREEVAELVKIYDELIELSKHVSAST